jgi:[acyl-carrier-protein] S-malonyltransferase
MSTGYLFAPQIRLRPGEYRELYEANGAVRARVAQASAVVDTDLAALLLGGADDDLNRGVIARPLVMAMSVGLYETAVAPAPDYLAGLSLGQITAAHLAGCLSFADAIATCHLMASIEHEHFDGLLYGVYFFCNADLDRLADAMSERDELGHYLRPCAYLADDQMIVTGTFAALRELATAALAFGALGLVIPYGPPAHCDLMQRVRTEFAQRWRIRDGLADPRVPLVCNLTTEVLTTGAAVGDALVSQYTRPVQWAGSIRRMAGLGVDTLVVPGPGGFVQRSLDCLAVKFTVTDGVPVAVA